MDKFMGHDDRERKFEKALERHLRQGVPRDASAAAHSQAEPACPDAALLAAFYERMLPNEEMDAAKQHIAACARCQEILAQLEVTDDVLVELEQNAGREKVLQLREPILAGALLEEELSVPHAAAPMAAARATGGSKTPRSISSVRGAKMWRWVAPAAAIAAGLLIWVTAHDTFHKIPVPANSIEVAQEKQANRQLTSDNLASASPASQPEQRAENGRLDESLKSLDESKRLPSGLLARRGPKGTLGGVVGGVAGAPSAQLNRELRSESGTNESDKPIPGKPAEVRPKDRKISQLPLSGRNSASPASKSGNPVTGAGAATDRDSGRDILEKQKLEPGVNDQLSASAVAAPQPSAPPPPAARAAAKQSADAAQKKEAATSAMTVTSEQAEVTANYENKSALQNAQADRAKTSNAKNKDVINKDAQLILTPGGTVLWRLRAGGGIDRSTDRGITWSSQNGGAHAELLAGSAPGDAVCWLVGRAGTILRTTDGGGHWSRVVSPIASDIGEVHAEDALHATIFDLASSSRFATSDGGVTWTPAKQ